MNTAVDAEPVISVVIDPRVLLLSMHEPAARSGIFRVTFELARYLLNDSRVRVAFRCDNLGEYLSLARFAHLERNNGFHHLLFSSWVSPASAIAWNIEEYVRGKHRATPGISTSTAGPWCRYLNLRYLLSRAAGALLALPFPPTGERQVSRFKVYHSTYFPLRESARSGPRFLTIHDLLPITDPQWFPDDKSSEADLKRVLKSIRRRDWVFTDSNATRKALLEHVPEIDPETVIVNHLAAGSEFRPVDDRASITAIRKKYGIPESEPYFLSVGTLEVRKNTVTLVKAFQVLLHSRQAPNVRLVLCGVRGWMTDPLFRVISEDPLLRSRIVLTGYVPDEDLPALYSDALCFVYVSLGEGFGLPVLEAMQCAAPVITSSVSSLPEVAGEAAIQVDPRDYKALASQMIAVLENNELRKNMAESSVRRARLFSWDNFGDKTVRTYQAAIESMQ